VRVEALADQINDLANSAQQVASDAVKSGENPNAAVAALRVQVDNKRWLLSKLAPRQFGDRNQVELSSAGGEPLVQRETDPARVALSVLALLHSLPGGNH